MAEKDVLGDGQLRDEIQVLIDDADAEIPALLEVGMSDIDAVDANLALVVSDGASKDFDEGRLAGPVLADEAVDLAPAQVEVHAVERDGPRVTLAEADGLEQQRFAHVGPFAHVGLLASRRVETAPLNADQ